METSSSTTTTSTMVLMRVNVGGTDFLARKETLCRVKTSWLASHVSSFDYQKWGVIYLDRSPASFVYVLDYLRNGHYDQQQKQQRIYKSLPESQELLRMVEDDADYYGLPVLAQACRAKRSTWLEKMVDRMQNSSMLLLPVPSSSCKAIVCNACLV